MSVVSDWVNRSAAGGNGGGEGKRWCKTGSKLNSKSANATGGESMGENQVGGESGQGRTISPFSPTDTAVHGFRRDRV